MIARIAVTCLGAAACGAALMHFAYGPYRCNATVSRLTARTDAAERTAGDYERIVRARRNLADLAGLRDSCPTQVRVPVLIGANQEVLGRLDDAAESYRSALEIEQRPEIYMALAKVQIQLGRIDDAVANYVTAARFAPPIVQWIPSADVRERVEHDSGIAEAGTPGK